MMISACYIVRNEERNLAYSLQSVANVVDEIIVVDTGSIDRTKEIAHRYAAKIFDFLWQDDFSAPRNYALEKATGDWIIFIDADEYFPPECQPNIRPLLEGCQRAGTKGLLLLRRYDIDVDNQNEILANTLVPRIFYHDSGYRYEGIIHEELLNDGEIIIPQQIVPEETVRLIHTGYSREQSAAKARRNLELLQKQLTSAQPPDSIYMYLADAYLGLNDKENAKHYAELDIAQGRRNSTYASRSYRILLQLSLENKDSLTERLHLCEMAVADFPESPEFRADLAACFAAMKNYQRASVEMSTALYKFHHYTGIEPMLMTENDAKTAGAHLAKWRRHLPMVDASALAFNLQLVIKAVCKLSAEEFALFAADEGNILPPGFQKIFAAYHQYGIEEPPDDRVAREYMDVLDVLLQDGDGAELSRLIDLTSCFSPAVQEQIIRKIDKRIEQAGQEENRC